MRGILRLCYLPLSNVVTVDNVSQGLVNDDLLFSIFEFVTFL